MRQKILETGVKIWRTDPSGVTARNIARKLNMSHTGVLYHFDGDLKDSVARYAVEIGDSRVIAQLIAMSHPAVSGMSKSKRIEHMSNM